MVQAQPVQYVQNVIPMFPAAGPPSSAAGPENGATDEERIKTKTDAEKKAEAKERKNDKAANMRVKACASKSLGSLFG